VDEHFKVFAVGGESGIYGGASLGATGEAPEVTRTLWYAVGSVQLL